MSALLKYVRHDPIGFVTWPVGDPRGDGLYHAHIGLALKFHVAGKLVSAGFAIIDQGTVRCYGESESLHMRSLPEDTALLAAQLGLSPT